MAAGAAAQQPDSRLIDTEPKIVFGPPVVETSGPRGDPRSTGRRDDPRTENERGLDLELDLEERRELKDRGAKKPQWLAAGIFVAGGGVLLLLVAWALRRRDR
jgi:hypothetical protein